MRRRDYPDAALAWAFKRYVLPRLIARSPYDFIPALALESVLATIAEVENEQREAR